MVISKQNLSKWLDRLIQIAREDGSFQFMIVSSERSDEMWFWFEVRWVEVVDDDDDVAGECRM